MSVRYLDPAAALLGVVALLGGLAPAAAIASPDIAAKAGCAVCHAVDKKSIGPSYHDIATKYKGRKDAGAMLAERVRKGSTGVWGQVPMPATDKAKLGDPDLKTVISWILKTP